MIDSEKIRLFLEGRDPQKRIVNIECGYGDEEVSVFSRNDLNKIVVNKEPFYPFIWAKTKAATKLKELYGGKDSFMWALRDAGLYFKSLKTTNDDGVQPKRMKEGYNVLFYATSSMSYNKFLKFFKDKKIDVYSQEREYMSVTPVEQFMIKTGKRYFKDFNEYDNLLRCTWDIETTGLDPNNCSITQIGIRTNHGFETILHVDGNTEEELILSERNVIQQFFRIIRDINPDILAGHNSEVFDWTFVLTRIKILFDEKNGETFNEIINYYWQNTDYDRCYRKKDKTLINRTLYKKDTKTVLKLGGEIEYFYQTVWYGHTVVDSLHGCRRAQAIDSNMKSGNLKYAAEYAKQKKPNRVYIPGDKISKMYYETSKFVLNESNGEWHKLNDELFNKTYKIKIGTEKKQITFYTDEEIQDAKNKLDEILDNNNVTSKDEVMEIITEDILNKSDGNIFEEKDIYEKKIKFSKINDDIFDNESNTKLDIVSGRYIADRYLLDDLYEGDRVEWYYNQSSFFLAKMLPIPYQKVLTMGTSANWKYLLLAWSFENDLAIPALDVLKAFTGGLSRLLRVGFVKKIVKLDYNSLYPSITLSWNIFPELDISGVFKALLDHILTERERYKGLKKEYENKVKKCNNEKELTELLQEIERIQSEIDKYESLASLYDKLQLPFKIFANAFFGSYGAPNIFNWGDVVCAENITCTARQCLRLMVKWFEDRGFKAIVGDSVTGDTPLYTKDKITGIISIKTFKEIFNNCNKKVDEYGREYDCSEKNYQVLCRTGWVDINYIYRHKTNKNIHRIKTKKGFVDVTDDHSLFNNKKEKINPKNIKIGDKIEIYDKQFI